MRSQPSKLTAKEGNFSRADLIRLFVPLLFEQLLTITVGLADSIMVSAVGEASISAVSMVDSISNLMIYFFTALATGGGAVVGQYIGRQEEENARKSGQQLLSLLFLTSLGLTILLYFFQWPILHALYGNVEDDVMEAVTSYYSIVMASIPAIALYNGGAALMRTMSRSDITLKVSALMNTINLIGNYTLIFVFGFDVSGVAIPTLVSRSVAAVIILLLLTDHRRLLYLQRGLSQFRLEKKLVRNVAYIGIPSGIENGMFHFGRLIVFSLVSSFGTPSLVAHSVGNTVGSFHVFSGMAIGVGITTIISQCVGAGKFDLARHYLKKLTIVTYALMAVINLLLIWAIPLILRLYGLEGETATLARSVMLIHSIGSIFIWIPAFLFSYFLRAAGDAKFILRVSMSTMWLIRVLFSYILGRYLHYGIVGVWVAQSVMDWFIRSVIFIYRVCGHKWEKMAIKS